MATKEAWVVIKEASVFSPQVLIEVTCDESSGHWVPVKGSSELRRSLDFYASGGPPPPFQLQELPPELLRLIVVRRCSTVEDVAHANSRRVGCRALNDYMARLRAGNMKHARSQIRDALIIDMHTHTRN